MAGIKVRVGQADAIKVLSSADRSSSAFSVSGGTASVTELTVSGHSTLNTLNVKGLAEFKSSDTPDIEGIIVDGFNEKIKVGLGVTITSGNIFARDLADFRLLEISGNSTFNGLVDINAGGQANTFTVENLTSGRVVLAGTSGQLTDNTNLTFSGSLLSIGVNLDVDGQTDLDVLNVAETATFTGNIDANGNINKNRVNANEAPNNEDLTRLVNLWQFRDIKDIPAIDNDNYKYFNENIVKTLELKLNGDVRLGAREYSYYNKIQPYNHHTGKLPKGVMVYSFSINPEDFQPSGACNFSNFESIELLFKLNSPFDNESLDKKNIKYDITLYTTAYNILKIENGECQLLFKT